MIELFHIGFLPITILDIVDIILVSAIFYKVYNVISGTVAAQIFYGLLLVLLLSFLAQAVNFIALGWLLKLLSDIWVIAFIILFQPEIRRILVLIGKTPLIKLFLKSDHYNISDIIAESAYELAQNQHGALIVLVKSGGIRGVVETGEIIDSKVSKNLLRSIFFPRSPLHDGAVIIRNDIIEAARCTLPLTSDNKRDGRQLGMRHKAGIGISEIADVICVIVSEETGSISIAENGMLKTGFSRDSLKKYLAESLKKSSDKSIRGILQGTKNI